MPLLAYFVLQLIFTTPPLSAPIWGLQGGESRDELLEQFRQLARHKCSLDVSGQRFY